MTTPTTLFQVGAWATPDKRGLGVAHRISVLHGDLPAERVPLSDGSFSLMSILVSDMRTWDSACGQIVRSAVTHSVPHFYTPAMMGCSACWALKDAGPPA